MPSSTTAYATTPTSTVAEIIPREGAAFYEHCEDLVDQIHQGSMPLARMLHEVAAIVAGSREEGFSSMYQACGIPDGSERATFALAQVVFAFNRVQWRAWKAGLPNRNENCVTASGTNAVVIRHPSIVPIRLERRAGVIAIIHASGEELVPIIAWSVVRTAIHRIWAKSWRPQVRFTDDKTALLRCLQPGAVRGSIGLRDPWLDESIYAWWQATLNAASPEIIALQRRLWAHGRRMPARWLRGDHLWRDPHVRKDIMTYRAAAIAAARIDALTDDGSADAGLEGMRHWMSLFSPDGRATRSLRRTLMNLPGGVFPGAVVGLRAITIDRPLVHRLEFLANVMPRIAWDPIRCRPCLANLRKNQPVLDHASEADLLEIRQAMRTDGLVPPGPLSVLGASTVFRYLLDYPMLYQGRVLGLWRRSRNWHTTIDSARRRSNTAEHRADPSGPPDLFASERAPRFVPNLAPMSALPGHLAETTPDYAYDTPVAMPSWDLPTIPGLTFLDTCGAIWDEGEQMSHCVGSDYYLQRACSGSSHFFHVDHDGHQATMELSSDGVVLEVNGPCNEENAASGWARRVMADWNRHRIATAQASAS